MDYIMNTENGAVLIETAKRNMSEDNDKRAERFTALLKILKESEETQNG